MPGALTGSTQLVGVLDTDGNIVDLANLTRGISDADTRLDYGPRTDTQPVYIGRAPMATETSAGSWTIERLTYDGSDRPVAKEVRYGSWDDRTTLFD